MSFIIHEVVIIHKTYEIFDLFDSFKWIISLKMMAKY